MKTQNEFKEIETLPREVILKQNGRTGKIDLTLRLKDYDLKDFLIEKGILPKRTIGKIIIEVIN